MLLYQSCSMAFETEKNLQGDLDVSEQTVVLIISRIQQEFAF